MTRADDLARALADVRKRIARAADASGRDAAGITLVAVSKTRPAEDVLLLHRLGIDDFGESTDQEAGRKAGVCADAGLRLRWHFVGQLQRNKCRSVARYADVIHSLDRPEVVTALGASARRAGRVVSGLVQVALGPGAARGGADPADVPALADLVAATDGLRLAGVMGVAPLDEPARAAFARLREVAATVRGAHPDAAAISAGMTGDLEDAVAEGATHLRIGSALFGRRDTPNH